MKKMRPFIAILLVLFSLALPASASDTQALPAGAEDTAALEKIDRFLTNLESQNLFSGTVLVGRGDEVLFQKGFGPAVKEWDIPNAPDTVFRIGSITKQFTAMAILKLQEDGRLNIDDPICDYLARCPDMWSEITIYHLLTHTSGIPSYTDLSEGIEIWHSDAGRSKVIDTIIDLPLQFEPGTEWYYNNSGYHLLGDIITKAAGISYRRYLQDNFFDPLEMHSTDLETNNDVISRRAEGYSGFNRRADYINMRIPYSAGAMISTVEDLFLWERALFSGRVVSQETLDAMWERAYPIDDVRSYGYGLIYDTSEEYANIWHNGGIYGFAAHMSYVPEQDLTVIILTNREDSPMPEILSMIFEALMGDKPASA